MKLALLSPLDPLLITTHDNPRVKPTVRNKTSPDGNDQDSSHAEVKSKHVASSNDSAHVRTLSAQRSCEDQNLARAANTKTLAEPGSNYLCISSQGELFD